MTEAVWGMVRAGANIIGGCCGVTVEHIAAFRAELDMLG
jgi:methionine synthase I (cobalamin-dependent)